MMSPRHQTRVLAPPGVFLSCLAFGFVVAFLVVDMPEWAGGVVAAYIVFGGRAGGRAPTWHVFAFAAFLLTVCGVVRILAGHGVGLAFIGTAALAVLAAGFVAWPSRGTTPSGDR